MLKRVSLMPKQLTTHWQLHQRMRLITQFITRPELNFQMLRRNATSLLNWIRWLLHGQKAARFTPTTTHATNMKFQKMASLLIVATWSLTALRHMPNPNVKSSIKKIRRRQRSSLIQVNSAFLESHYIHWDHGQMVAKFSRHLIHATLTRFMQEGHTLNHVI